MRQITALQSVHRAVIYTIKPGLGGSALLQDFIDAALIQEQGL
jgi:hypothetical protein